MPISMISTNQDKRYEFICYRARRCELYYVCTCTSLHVCTICSFVFAKNFFKKTGGIWPGGLLVRGAIGQGADVRGACVHGGICPGAIVRGGGALMSWGQLAGYHLRYIDTRKRAEITKPLVVDVFRLLIYLWTFHKFTVDGMQMLFFVMHFVAWGYIKNDKTYCRTCTVKYKF